jgi:hypothetical protein
VEVPPETTFEFLIFKEKEGGKGSEGKSNEPNPNLLIPQTK